jgi:acyl carrier protein
MKRRTFILKSSTVLIGSMISSCGSIKGSSSSLSKQEIKDKIFSAFVHNKPTSKAFTTFDPKTFGWDKNLVNELGFDSLDTVEFVMELEKMFDISIKDADAEKIKTPYQAVEIVQKCLKMGAKTILK